MKRLGLVLILLAAAAAGCREATPEVQTQAPDVVVGPLADTSQQGVMVTVEEFPDFERMDRLALEAFERAMGEQPPGTGYELAKTAFMRGWNDGYYKRLMEENGCDPDL